MDCERAWIGGDVDDERFLPGAGVGGEGEHGIDFGVFWECFCGAEVDGCAGWLELVAPRCIWEGFAGVARIPEEEARPRRVLVGWASASTLNPARTDSGNDWRTVSCSAGSAAEDRNIWSAR